MIILVRADDRLIHGMVAVSWTSAIKPETILVANDEAAGDSFKAATMKLAKPAGVKLIIKTCDDSIKALNNPINDRKKMPATSGNASRGSSSSTSARPASTRSRARTTFRRCRRSS